MTLHLPNDIINGSLADAVPVEQNYELIQDYINNQVINADGSVAMTGPLLLAGSPTQPNQAVNKTYADAIMPVGIMMPWPGSAAPAGNWRLCNGASLAVANYPALHGVIGYSYGGSGGSFLLPNTTGRLLVTVDPSRPAFAAVGKVGGDWDIPVPAHVHAMAHTHEHPHTHLHSHTHSIAHDHGQVNTTDAGDHIHYFSYMATQQDDGGPYARIIGYVGGGLHAAVGNAGNHHHAVNLPAFAGDTADVHGAAPTAQPNEATTSGVSTANTASTGTAGAEHIPPFVTINYIIRIV
jgi:microcystin-dependent protein